MNMFLGYSVGLRQKYNVINSQKPPNKFCFVVIPTSLLKSSWEFLIDFFFANIDNFAPIKC